MEGDMGFQFIVEGGGERKGQASMGLQFLRE
jgi:hypothetical protein